MLQAGELMLHENDPLYPNYTMHVYTHKLHVTRNVMYCCT